MGWLYPVRSKSSADLASATTKFMSDVGNSVMCFRTDNGAELVTDTSARLCSDQTIRHEHMGVDGPKNNGVVGRGLDLIQDGGMAACLEVSRLFPRQLPDLIRYLVEAVNNMNDCLNTTMITATPHCKSPYEMFLGRLPPANVLAFMQPSAHTSKAKAERCVWAELPPGPN